MCTRELIERSLAGDRSAFELLIEPLLEQARRGRGPHPRRDHDRRQPEPAAVPDRRRPLP